MQLPDEIIELGVGVSTERVCFWELPTGFAFFTATGVGRKERWLLHSAEVLQAATEECIPTALIVQQQSQLWGLDPANARGTAEPGTKNWNTFHMFYLPKGYQLAGHPVYAQCTSPNAFRG